MEIKNFIRKNYYVLTGGPGADKTARLPILQERGFTVVQEEFSTHHQATKRKWWKHHP